MLSPWDAKLGNLWPRWSSDDEMTPEIAALVGPLTEMRDRLQREAADSGWEID